MSNYTYMLCDTETTGVTPKDKVVELAFIELATDFSIISEGCARFNPGIPIPQAASEVHGIYDADVANCPDIVEYMATPEAEIFKRQNLVFIAHNAPFDYRFMREFMPETTVSVCTLSLARQVFLEAPNHKLGTLGQLTGFDTNSVDLHSAAGDLKVLAHVLKSILDRKFTTLDGLLNLWLASRTKVVIPFGKFRGKTPAEVVKLGESRYLRWLLTLDNLDETTRAAVDAAIKKV